MFRQLPSSLLSASATSDGTPFSSLGLDDTESLIPAAASHVNRVFTSRLRPDYRHEYGLLLVYTMHQSETVRELTVWYAIMQTTVSLYRTINMVTTLALYSITSGSLALFVHQGPVSNTLS